MKHEKCESCGNPVVDGLIHICGCRVENSVRSARPNIIKMKITQVGGFLADGKPDNNWAFEGSRNPASVGCYLSDGWVLFGGYTVGELQEIKQLAAD